MLKIILTSLIIFYLGATVALFAFQDNLLFFPRKLDRNYQNNKYFTSNEISFKNKNIKLHGWHFNRKAQNIIIYYGGNAEEISYNALQFKGLANFSLLLVNYRGYGASEGKPSQDAIFQDSLLAFDKIAVNYKKKFLVGWSLGSAVATYVASERKTDGVVLVCPMDSVRSLAKTTFSYLPIDYIIKNPFDSDKYAKKILTPALFIYAQNDRIIPLQHSENLFNNWAGKKNKVIIQGSSHNYIKPIPMYFSSIKKFIESI